MYFGLSVTHRVNQWLDHSFSADRSENLQSYGQPYTTYNVRWSPNWKVFRKISLSTPVWWQHGKQYYFSTGAGDNTYDQFGAGLNLGRQLTQKLSCSLAYQFTQETSNQSDLNYKVNTISLNFTYQF
jgi:outer membrane protein assembly factor BamA